MTLQLKQPPLFYFTSGFYWMVSDDILIQFNENFYNRWPPGLELFYYKKKELSLLKPINNSLGEYILGKIKADLETCLTEQAA